MICSDRHLKEALEEIAGARVRGQQCDSPRLHPFPARMPLSVAELLIERTTRPGMVVLDPMAGSGTTLIAAQKLGRQGLGFDRDPLALLVARSTIQPFKPDSLNDLRERILERARKRAGCIRFPQMRDQLPEEDRAFIRYWFPPQSQRQLFALAQSIRAEPEGAEQDLAWVVFSSLIIAKSAGASYALDLPRSRPHRRLDKPVLFPFDGWEGRFRSAIRRLPFAGDNAPDAKSWIQPGDARFLPVEDRAADLMLTSPPYFNAINYVRTHKFSLVWMGHRLKDLRELRGATLGAERGLWHLDGLPSGMEERLHRDIAHDYRRAQARRYLSDLNRILKETERVLRPGGLAFFVVGPSLIGSKRTDAVEILSRLGESAGLCVAGSVVRRLNPARRSLPLPKATEKSSALVHRMRREVIVALRK